MPRKKKLESRVSEPTRQIDIPERLSEKCELLAKMRVTLADKSLAINHIKEGIDIVEDDIMHTLKEQGNTVAEGGGLKVKLESKVFYGFEDRDKFNQYIIDNGAWDLLQSRIGTKAVAARIENGEVLPVASVKKDVLKVSAKR